MRTNSLITIFYYLLYLVDYSVKVSLKTTWKISDSTCKS